jgi:hypothetical protein
MQLWAKHLAYIPRHYFSEMRVGEATGGAPCRRTFSFHVGGCRFRSLPLPPHHSKAQ